MSKTFREYLDEAAAAAVAATSSASVGTGTSSGDIASFTTRLFGRKKKKKKKKGGISQFRTLVPVESKK